MTTSTSPRHSLALLVTLGVFGGVVVFICVSSKPEAPAREDKTKDPVKMRNPEEWPLFGGTVSRNLVNLVDKNVPTDWDITKGKGGNIKWSVDLGTKAYGGPVIAGGKLFMGTNNGQPRDPKITGDKGVMMCFDAKTGQFLWQTVYDKLADGRVKDWPEEGICSAPFVEGDKLYYVSNRCEVVCANVANGNAVWKLDMIGKLNVFPHNLATCSPLAVGDTLFVITSNGVDLNHLNIPQPNAPSFLALNKKDGSVKWKSNLPSIELVNQAGVGIKKLVDEGKVLMHGQWSNPVYAEPNGKPMIIFPGGDGWIRAFNAADGTLLWKFDCNPKSSFYVLGPKATRNDFVSTPVVWEDKLYIGVGQDPEHLKGVGHLWCIDLVKASDLGAKNKDNDVSPWADPAKSPKFDPKDPKNKDSAFVWHFGGENPTRKPRPYFFGRSMSTCSVHDGLLFACEYDGWVHCIDARTGEQYWEHDMEADCWSSPYYVDGKIYQGNENGQILVFEHNKKKKLINTIEMGSGTLVRATPVVVNGTMYVATENPCKLYAITPGGK
jgi:outer membrane protein assembly factor BamB